MQGLGWQQAQVSRKEYRDTMRVHRDEVRKTEAHAELELVMPLEGKKRAFYGGTSSKMEISVPASGVYRMGNTLGDKNSGKGQDTR